MDHIPYGMILIDIVKTDIRGNRVGSKCLKAASYVRISKQLKAPYKRSSISEIVVDGVMRQSMNLQKTRLSVQLGRNVYTHAFSWIVDIKMQNFIISLTDNNKKRKDHIRCEFSKQNISFEFFDAITPNQSDRIILSHNLKISSNLTRGEIAFFLSHYMTWKKIVDENIPFAAIFEDDIFLGDNASVFLNDHQWIDNNIDIIKLEKGWQSKIITPFFACKTVGDRRLYKLMSDHYGAAGYIISNKGACYLIDYFSNRIVTQAVDVVIFDALLTQGDFTVQQLLPALCVQDFILNNGYENFHSDLEAERASKYNIPPTAKFAKKIRHSNLFKIKRETKRLITKAINPARILKRFLLERSVTFK